MPCISLIARLNSRKTEPNVRKSSLELLAYRTSCFSSLLAAAAGATSGWLGRGWGGCTDIGKIIKRCSPEATRFLHNNTARVWAYIKETGQPGLYQES